MGIKSGEPHYKRRALVAELKLAREKRWAPVDLIDAALAKAPSLSDSAVTSMRSQLHSAAFMTDITGDAVAAIHDAKAEHGG